MPQLPGEFLISWMTVGEVSGFLQSLTNMCAQLLSRVYLFASPRMVARQAPLTMECSRQEDWSGVTFPTLGDLPNPGI